MNVYDFDHTIYDGDSSVDFAIYCIAHHPILFCFIPILIFAGCMAKTGLLCSKRSKELFFSFLRIIPASSKDVDSFWLLYRRKIQNWYLVQQKKDDLIISASPAFLLSPLVTQMMQKELIATNMNPMTGKIQGENCKGIHKENELYKRKKNVHIHSFYSDSLSDTPLALKAEKAYLVSIGKRRTIIIRPWPL